MKKKIALQDVEMPIFYVLWVAEILPPFIVTSCPEQRATGV